MAMVQIKDAKVSKSGSTHYISIPIDFIRNDIIDPKKHYNIQIFPIEENDIKEVDQK